MPSRIDRVLAECQRRIEEMRTPLKEIDIQDILEGLDEEDRLEVSEQENKYHGTWDWEYDLDPVEM